MRVFIVVAAAILTRQSIEQGVAKDTSAKEAHSC